MQEVGLDGFLPCVCVCVLNVDKVCPTQTKHKLYNFSRPGSGFEWNLLLRALCFILRGSSATFSLCTPDIFLSVTFSISNADKHNEYKAYEKRGFMSKSTAGFLSVRCQKKALKADFSHPLFTTDVL